MKNKYPFLEEIKTKYQNTDSIFRFLVGIVGPPASGKSTIAEQLPVLVNEQLGQSIATHFNMDGYHYHNTILEQKGIYPHKGAHFTFDVQAFMEKMLEIKEQEGQVKCPVYDRSLHNPTPNAHLIKETHKIVFVEGNYLLLSVFPWTSIRFILDYCIFLTVDPAIQYQRLLDRHTSTGKEQTEAMAKIHRTDLPNSDLILKDQWRADYLYKN